MAATGEAAEAIDSEEATGTWFRDEAATKAEEVDDDEEATGAWSREEQGSKFRAEGLFQNLESPPDPEVQDRVERGSEGGDGK